MTSWPKNTQVLKEPIADDTDVLKADTPDKKRRAPQKVTINKRRKKLFLISPHIDRSEE